MIAAASHLVQLFLAGVFVTALALGMLSPAVTGVVGHILAQSGASTMLASVSTGVDVVGSIAGGLLATWVYGRPRTQ